MTPIEIVRALPANEPLYAVLDCARDPRLRGWIYDTHLPRWCLFRGDLPRALEDAAPHLLKLEPRQPWLDRFLQRGWGRSWGILFTSPAPSRELRRHLRRFLRVRTEDKRILVFRYYDPRVLRAYLPTCTAEETATFFGPITAMAAEGSDPAKSHLFRLPAPENANAA